MAIGQARLKPLTLSALATRERSTGERRRVERNKLFLSVTGEIRCQFIILARKDEPTPDYAPDYAKR